MKIIFVCTGNTCRSPMAEGYLNSFGFPFFTVLSRGLSAGGQAVSDNAVSVMKEWDIDISSHISAALSKDDLDADLFAVMSDYHKEVLLSLGISDRKITVLSGGIPDPYGCDETHYRLCRDAIARGIEDMTVNGTLFDFKISPATREDLKEIAVIEKECFSLPWSEDALASSLAAGTVIFTAKRDNKLLGYAGYSPVADEGYITNIAVKSDCRKGGVGSALVAALIIDARKRGLSFISLEVRPSNLGAVNIYSAAGFKEAGRRKNFYTAPKEDAIIMTKWFKR